MKYNGHNLGYKTRIHGKFRIFVVVISYKFWASATFYTGRPKDNKLYLSHCFTHSSVYISVYLCAYIQGSWVEKKHDLSSL